MSGIVTSQDSESFNEKIIVIMHASVDESPRLNGTHLCMPV